MAFFLVTMTHTDLEGWTRHLQAHVAYLRRLVSAGSLRASGPLTDAPVKAGFLIITAADRTAADAIIADDPFAKEGLIDELTIRHWDPLFGAFAAEASGTIPSD